MLSDAQLAEILDESDFYLSDDNDAGFEVNEALLENMFPDENLDQENYVEEQVGENSGYDTEDELPLSEVKKRSQKKSKQSQQRKQQHTWNKEPFANDSIDLPEFSWNASPDHEFWTPLDYFSQYFNDDFFENVSTQSNVRAMQANEIKPLRSTAEEYKKLVGIHIVMGIFGLPRLRLYFMKGMEIPIITQIPRDRIFKLRNFLHVVDNLSVPEAVKETNKLWKVQPILDAVREKCLTLARAKELSIDEQMIPFSGTTSLRQYVKNKPNPVGLKNFVLASPCGLVHDFFIYQGAKTWPNGTPDPELGIGGSVIKRLVADLSPGHIIYCDRYFTSINLFDYLRSKGILAVGTILTNRIPSNLRNRLKKDKQLLSEGRGSYEEWVRDDNAVSVLKWMDNRSVTVASTFTGASPLHDVRRWDKKESKYVLVPCPDTVARYNKSMGGVDLCDRIISYYRIAMRTKKWPVRVFWHFVDLVISNCWNEYRLDRIAFGDRKGAIMDVLEFKMYIGRALALGGKSRNHRKTSPQEEAINEAEDRPEETAPTPKRRKATDLPPTDVRKSDNAHLPICSINDKNSYMRCRNVGCSKKNEILLHKM